MWLIIAILVDYQPYQKGCKNNIRAEEEQIFVARPKQNEDEEEDTGIRPKEKKRTKKSVVAFFSVSFY